MATKIRLRDIVDALEMQGDEDRAYMNLETGEVHVLGVEFLSQAEESDEEEHEDLGLQLARKIKSSDNFERLPTKFDIHEWSIMQEFCQSVTSDSLREELMDAIHGRGAFRVFKSVVYRHHIEKDWYAFRDEALREIARDWCEEHELAWE